MFPTPLRTVLLLRHHVALDGWRVRFALLLPSLFGLVLTLRSQTVLQRGVTREAWTEEQLEVARASVNQRRIFWLQVGLTLLVIGSDLWRLNLRPGSFFSFGLLTVIASPLFNMKRVLRKPLIPVAPISFRDLKPIQSDRWGQPPASS
jgi:hypothetical protein